MYYSITRPIMILFKITFKYIHICLIKFLLIFIDDLTLITKIKKILVNLKGKY